MSAGLEYFNNTKKLIDNLYESEMDNIIKASELCANSISKKGLELVTPELCVKK